jgi:hypothetical protein
MQLLAQDDIQEQVRRWMFKIKPNVDTRANDIPDEGQPDWECRRVNSLEGKMLLDG